MVDRGLLGIAIMPPTRTNVPSSSTAGLILNEVPVVATSSNLATIPCFPELQQPSTSGTNVLEQPLISVEEQIRIDKGKQITVSESHCWAIQLL